MAYKLYCFLSLLSLINGATYYVTVDKAENLTDKDPDAPEILGSGQCFLPHSHYIFVYCTYYIFRWRAWVNKNDPYVQVIAYGRGSYLSHIDDQLTINNTDIKKGTDTPRWDQEFLFNDDDSNGPYTKFLFKVYDDDSTFKKDGPFDWLNVNDPDYLGETREISVLEIVQCAPRQFEFRLPVKRDGKECGILVVEISKNECDDSECDPPEYPPGYILTKNGECKCVKQPGDSCYNDWECCDYYCVDIGGRKQCWLE